jgi:hypothetical protein
MQAGAKDPLDFPALSVNSKGYLKVVKRWFWERCYALLTTYLALHVDALLLVLHVEAPGELLDEAAAAYTKQKTQNKQTSDQLQKHVYKCKWTHTDLAYTSFP